MQKKKIDKKELARLKKHLKEKEKEIQALKSLSINIYSSDINESLSQIAENIASLTACDECFIYLYNPKNEQFVFKASKSGNVFKGYRGILPEEISEKFAMGNAPVEFPASKFPGEPQETGFKSVFCLPFIYGGKANAAAALLFTKKQASLKANSSILSAALNQMAAAINNSAMSEDIKHKNKELDTLSQISKTIVSGKYLEEILDLVVKLTADMMGSKICSIMLLEKAAKELKIIATQSLSEEYRSKPNLKVGQSISGKALLEKKPITVMDVTKEQGYFYRDIAKREGLCSMLAVPMYFREKAIGVINIYTTDEHKFTSEEIRVLQSVANQAAIVIENMNLIQETISAKEALESRKMIERAKGVLMKKFGIAEDEAYKTIHKKSMDSRKSMKEVSEAILLTLEQDK